VSRHQRGGSSCGRHDSPQLRIVLFFFFAIVECLDTGDEFPCEGPDGDHRALVAAFANTLVALLDSLIEPVVPAHLHAQCLQSRDKDEAFEVLNSFPHESINVGGHLVGLWTSSTDGLTSTAQGLDIADGVFALSRSAARIKGRHEPDRPQNGAQSGYVSFPSVVLFVCINRRPASIFAPVLLRDDPAGVYPRASPVGKRDFLLRFID
jgi:phosphatidylinositol-bisphosphatase